jgi:hypothetical protein
MIGRERGIAVMVAGELAVNHALEAFTELWEIQALGIRADQAMIFD